MLIGLHLKSKLMARSLNTVYESVKSGKHLKIDWSNIKHIYTAYKGHTNGLGDMKSYTYKFLLKNHINGMREITINRKFFAGHENEFERLIHKYSGLRVDRQASTFGELQFKDSMSLLIVVIIAVILLGADKLGLEPENWPVFKQWLDSFSKK
jgi:hypothetical protein